MKIVTLPILWEQALPKQYVLTDSGTITFETGSELVMAK
jgi:hypothetical protein